MPPVKHNGFLLTIPKPLLVVVEDVGWWQGQDGSTVNEPFRSGMNREHCLQDYQALLLLARRLQMRIQISMVLCEWDRSSLLRHVPGATWMGEDWCNPTSQDILEETSDFLRVNSDHLEIGLHGVGHEFWKNKRMERSEFHDTDNIMRPSGIIRQHLDAFAAIMEENGLGLFPQAFVPPALYHSFGNAEQSFQAILREYGVSWVSTIFSRARQYAPPVHEKLTWESDVLLIEREEAPVPWHIHAAPPTLPHAGPIVALHWKNLLHLDPHRNEEVIIPWVELLSSCGKDFNRILARDTASCWSQFAYHSLAKIEPLGDGVEIDIGGGPNLSSISRHFFLKIRDEQHRSWRISNGKMISSRSDGPVTQVCIEFFSRSRPIYLTPRSARASV
ncbi:MAG: hypothetical protein KJ804_21550 [Proteobacteria bacterium]|nr:hypothetical protein [Pseudomonadota bacterium]MBU1060895.1 hypothetical protein [Pseudomonadota bacterium]